MKATTDLSAVELGPTSVSNQLYQKGMMHKGKSASEKGLNPASPPEESLYRGLYSCFSMGKKF